MAIKKYSLILPHYHYNLQHFQLLSKMKFHTGVILSVCALSAFHSSSSNNNNGNSNALLVNAFAPQQTSSRAFQISNQSLGASSSSTARFNAAVGETTTVVTNDAFTLETTTRANPNLPGPIHKLTFHSIPGQDEDTPPLVLETGKIGRQAAGAIEMKRGDTTLYATAARDGKPKDNIDFLPLSVEHSERFSSAGMTSGSYNKRDGRPAEHEILTCRLIDRPLRPLINAGWRHETQLLSWVLSYDGERSCDPLAITASATALYISDVPLSKPVAAVNVGYIDEKFVINPTNKQQETSRLLMTVAGTKDGIMMIEGAADFLPEDVMLEALKFGHVAVMALCDGIEELAKLVGKEKYMDSIKPPLEGLQEKVDALMTEGVDAMYNDSGNKDTNGAVMKELQDATVAAMEEDYPEEKTAIKGAFKDLLCRRMFVLGKEKGLRCDGRALDEIRQLDMETGFLPKVHGSALFTRGETQAIATATLGDSGSRQKIDSVDGTNVKRFYLQYTFPPSCVGETGRVGMPGRREVGHGNLAERALLPTLPTEAEFPYTIRLESLITESHGSSSMASVCGGSLALMDAGVPVKSAVAGVAMGMLLGDKGGVSDENAIILTDILGTEDALGTMDFKVAGDKDGITTFQMDIKCEGLTIETMERALEQARVGRMHLLSEMEKVLAGPRVDLPPTVPKMRTSQIPPENIGKIIGPGGKQIRAIIEDFELENMDVNEEGRVQVSGFDTSKLKEAEEFIQKLIEGGGRGGGGRGGGDRDDRPKYAGPEPEVGKIYQGKVVSTLNFGVFVEFMPGAEDGSTPGLEGLCHVSQLAKEHVRNCEGFMRAMNKDVLEVKYLGLNDRGKYQLSRKAVLEERSPSKKPDDTPPPTPPPAMSKDEIDVIAQAIADVAE